MRGAIARGEGLVRHGDEVEPVTPVVADLDEGSLVIGLDDGAYGAGRPAAGVGDEFDDVEYGVSRGRHLRGIVAGGHGMSTSLGGASPSTIQVVTTEWVAPLSPSMATGTSYAIPNGVMRVDRTGDWGDGFPLLNISTLAGDRALAWFDELGWQLDVLDRLWHELRLYACGPRQRQQNHRSRLSVSAMGVTAGRARARV